MVRLKHAICSIARSAFYTLRNTRTIMGFYPAAGPTLEYILLILMTRGITVSAEAVYFTMDTYTTTIAQDFPDHKAIARVYTRVISANASVVYALEVVQTSHTHQARTFQSPADDGEARHLFTIDQKTGIISLQQSTVTRGNLTGWNFTLQISAWTQRERLAISDLGSEPLARALVMVNMVASPLRCACFGEADYSFRLRVNAANGAFGALSFPPRCSHANGASFEYAFLPERSSDGLYIDNRTSELVLIRRSGAQLQSRNLTVKCTVEDAASDGDQKSDTRQIMIHVPDYNVSVRQNRSKGDRVERIWTHDPRVKNLHTIAVSLAGEHKDAYGFIGATNAPPSVDLAQSGARFIGEIIFNQTFSRCYEARHILTLVLLDGATRQAAAAQGVTITVEINLLAERNVLNLTLHRNASLYTRVAVLEFPSCPSMILEPPTSFLQDGGLLRLNRSSLFVFVGDTTPLTNENLTTYAAVAQRQVAWGGDRLATEMVLHIDIIGERKPDFRPECDLPQFTATCSRHNSPGKCVNSCGIGAPDGRCKWRQQKGRAHTTNFSTCSPDLNTCPDAVCDSLELFYPRLCPQDCIVTTEPNYAHMMTLNDNRRGIRSAIGPCSCELDGQRCICDNFLDHPVQRQTTQDLPPVDHTTVGLVSYPLLTTVSPSRLFSKPDDGSAGDDKCTFCDTLIAVMVASLVLGVLALLVYTRVSRGSPLRRLFSGRNYKPPAVIDGSDSRLNSVLSECSDDGLHLSKGSMTRLKTEFDPKWEFPRQNLVLDKVLGEGEFGCVVRAQALSIRGHTGYTTVAVKMLKGSYSADDLQDLITEMNLLKDLNHPNVVKLLGASTQRGPLYVIVEYCQHGCLRDFLRQNRQAAAYQQDDSSLHDYDKIQDEGNRSHIEWNNRNLLSFAWQICKGMQYLAMLKLVHRDLAARNILVAEGMVVKVSDFGLARDLYESGTYVKRSKSRIPMKWMAPESLFDNIYTTKTDVWSFGVLFWEILTMGAMPYPGIMSHKLCQMVRQGHRLERPDGCAEELYSVMQQCWHSDPNDRPDFDMLGTMLERIMEKDADYLDLSCSPYGDCSDEEASASGSGDVKSSSSVPLLQIPTSDSPGILPLSVSLKKDHQLMTDDRHLKEIIVEEETNVDSGPLYGDMDPCRLYSNINNNFIADHLCKTVSEPNLSSTDVFLE
ncbi:proto-oncogene tyrosine-protein kinase receptor Ret-like [Acanthaster planci]|uniref:receptor protein-tyrosine kinase n=1 Tax=Acanthaster planci TaxID=133434 RepID=A0A8B7Y565_ACAPL|nr:proto-oncogene tyrosine-protein kinase receptor Ret-like [Acanthaster planci]